MVDIRPIEYQLEGLDFQKGSILALPFEDQSIKSLSSLCVVEHIGLGRYGDPIDPWGSEKAVKELQRVLAIEGNLYFSVPVDSQCQIFFNAHRAFTRDYVITLFDELVLRDEIYVYVDKLYSSYDASKRFGTGIYWFSRVR
jgi:SAM-dependent methyltransferase